MNNTNLHERLQPLINTISEFFAPPKPRLFGTCVTHSSRNNIQTHTPVEIITDKATGEKHCNCPSFRHCIKAPRVIADAKPLRY